MHHKCKVNHGYWMQNNQWKIIGDQLLTKSPVELKEHSDVPKLLCHLVPSSAL